MARQGEPIADRFVHLLRIVPNVDVVDELIAWHWNKQQKQPFFICPAKSAGILSARPTQLGSVLFLTPIVDYG